MRPRISRRGVDAADQAEQVAREYEYDLQVSLGSNIPKLPGQVVQAVVKLGHTGYGEQVMLTWIVAQSNPLPGSHEEDRAKWSTVAQQQVSVNTDAARSIYTVTLAGTLPNTGYQNYDCRIICLRPGQTLAGPYGTDKWYDDVYTSPAQAYDMNDEAQFT